MSSRSPDSEAAPSVTRAVRERPAQRYVGIHMRLAPGAFQASIDEGFPELFAWLAARGLEPAGAPFIRYYAMEPGDDGEVVTDLDLGVPVCGVVETDGWVHEGELPAGGWVSTIHTGSYDGLRDATAALGDWARGEGLEQLTGDDGRVVGWAEHYLTDPRAEPDSARWRTEIAVLVER